MYPKPLRFSYNLVEVIKIINLVCLNFLTAPWRIHLHRFLKFLAGNILLAFGILSGMALDFQLKQLLFAVFIIFILYYVLLFIHHCVLSPSNFQVEASSPSSLNGLLRGAACVSVVSRNHANAQSYRRSRTEFISIFISAIRTPPMVPNAGYPQTRR